MIVQELVKVTINPANIKNLEAKGYDIPRYYDENNRKYSVKKDTKIEIKVTDLTHGSRVKVKCACDYCGESKMKAYTEYNKSINTNEYVKKYCCENCDHLKIKEIYECKQEKGLLKFGDTGYWTFRENRLKELKRYINEIGNIENMQGNKFGRLLLTIFREYNERIDTGCIELGFDLSKLRKKGSCKPPYYYEDFENLKNGISELIGILKRFPKQKEVLEHLRIGNNILLSYGGIKKIKEIMGYCDENDLIDNRGYKNSSSYEYMVAQYLIGNSIPYKREQYPFGGKYKRLRSDFTFYLENEKEIHVEVWGYSQTDKASKRSITYNEKRIVKETLYNESGYLLIGINYETFQGKYSEVQNKLYNIFSPYLDLDYKNVDQKSFIPSNKISDKELLNEIMKYSDDEVMLPKQSKLQKEGVSFLYIEAINRYGNYYKFAEKFGKLSLRKRKAWQESDIFETFDYMVNHYGFILKNEHLKKVKDVKIVGVDQGAKKVFGSFIRAKVIYYDYLTESNIQLSKEDKNYIDDAINLKNGFNKTYITDELFTMMKNIQKKQLNLINPINLVAT